MALFQRLRDARRRVKAKSVVQEFANQLYASPICSDYENVFAQVRPLIDEMIKVMPYGVGRNGAIKPINETPELKALLEPNDDMGYIDFMDTAFATWLTENQLYIHVHFNKGDRIKGYTILPPTSRVNLGNGRYYWQVETEDGIETISNDEVMTLRYSRSPRNIMNGVSPATASRTYAQIDDLLAQFEKAYLANGAIPASITIIRASTQERYEEARRELEMNLKGASNRNKTLYIWRQFNNDDGTEKDQVEVKPIQGNNNTLAIREIVDVVNDRLNKAYGVSNFILGDDSSAKYDNAELSDFQFTRRRVKPALIKFWSEFQHELDRITGGLGYAIDFTLDMPELTKRKKVEAETSEKNVKNIKDLIEAGASPEFACKALKLTGDWFAVASGIHNRVLADRQIALQMNAEQITALDKKQKTAIPSASSSQKESAHDTCQHHHHADYYQPFSDEEVVEKQIFERLMALARAIFAEDPTVNLIDIQTQIYKLLEEEANRGGEEALGAIADLIDDPKIEAELVEMIKNGEGKISEPLGRRLHERSDLLVQNFDAHTREVMRAALDTEEVLTAQQLKERLESVLPTGRAATIARNETVYAFKSGSLELDRAIAKKYNLQIELTWHARKDSDTCNICAAMDGEKTTLGQSYADSITKQQGDKLINGKIVGIAPEGADPNDYTGDFTFAWTQDQWNDDGTIPNAHVNCRCYYTRKVIRSAE